MGAVFLYDATIKSPAPFIPEIQMTDKKEQLIKKIRLQIEKFSKNIYGRGVYKAYIWDFSDADTSTMVLITNINKKVMVLYPIEFYDKNGNEAPHINMGVHVEPDEPMDYDVGGIQYLERVSDGGRIDETFNGIGF